MKLLITGSRNFKDQDFFDDILNNEVEQDIELIIHGGALGTDTLAETYASENRITSKIIKPIRKDISSYYLHRNAEMVALCDEVIAFWDGKSRGTKFTIDYAKSRKRPVKIIKIN